jgi:hypothetical protein
MSDMQLTAVAIPTFESSYAARVLWLGSSGWSAPSAPAAFTTLPRNAPRLPAPHLLTHDQDSITIAWDAPPDAPPAALAVDMRAGPDGPWQCAATTVRGAAMRKKNLAPARDYYFRLRAAEPAAPELDGAAPPPAGTPATGVPSPPLRTAMLSARLAGLVGGPGAQLILPGGGEAPAARLLAGKVRQPSVHPSVHRKLSLPALPLACCSVGLFPFALTNVCSDPLYTSTPSLHTLPPSTHERARAREHAHTHAHAHARTHARTHTHTREME